MCEGTGLQGYPCDGSGEEVRSCNEKKCPGQSMRRLKMCFLFLCGFISLRASFCDRDRRGYCICMCSICICTVFVKQIESDSWWFHTTAKGFQCSFKTCTPLVFICLLSLFLSTRISIHLHLIDCASPRLLLSVLSSGLPDRYSISSLLRCFLYHTNLTCVSYLLYLSLFITLSVSISHLRK